MNEIDFVYFSGLARRVRALRNAQESIDDEINDRQIESENSPEVVDDRYQIVDSFLPSNGKYQIENRMSKDFRFNYAMNIFSF